MKKFTALAGVLLLSSSVLVACTPNAAPDNTNRAGKYNTAGNTGRVTDLGTTDNNRLGVRNIAPNRTLGGDPDRLGVRDNFGPDRPGAVTSSSSASPAPMPTRRFTTTRPTRWRSWRSGYSSSLPCRSF